MFLPHNVTLGAEYGTPAWNKDRRGRVTASRFGDVLTQPRSKAAQDAGQLSDTAHGYLLEVVASTITGHDRVGGKSAAMARGVDKEADAIDAYGMERFVEVGEGRILLVKDSLVAVTPDGFIEDDPEGPGLLECKCPESKTHLETFFSGAGTPENPRLVPEEYVAQVQGQLWVSGRAWCDFVSFDDRFPGPMQLIRIRAYRNEVYIAELAAKVRRFEALVQERVDQVREYLASCSPAQARVLHNALQESLREPTLHGEG